jgi:hypothetical protein
MFQSILLQLAVLVLVLRDENVCVDRYWVLGIVCKDATKSILNDVEAADLVHSARIIHNQRVPVPQGNELTSA